MSTVDNIAEPDSPDEVFDNRFIANPHALIKDGVVTDVVYMQNYGSEQIAETLSKYEYDKVVLWEDYGAEIYVGYVEYGQSSEIYYAPPQPYPSWDWDKPTGRWLSPVEHPWDVERRTNTVLNTQYEWDEELVDWSPTGELDCCG